MRQRIATLQSGRGKGRHHTGDATPQFAIAHPAFGVDQHGAVGPALDGAANQVGVAATLVQRELFGHGFLNLTNRVPGAGA